MAALSYVISSGGRTLQEQAKLEDKRYQKKVRVVRKRDGELLVNSISFLPGFLKEA